MLAQVLLIASLPSMFCAGCATFRALGASRLLSLPSIRQELTESSHSAFSGHAAFWE